jgi:hypothetical protein
MIGDIVAACVAWAAVVLVVLRDLERGEKAERVRQEAAVAAAEQERRAQQKIGDIVGALHRVTDELSATHKQEKGYEDHKGRRERWTIAGIFTAAVIAMITLVVTHRDTMHALKEARIASGRQHDDTQAALRLAAEANRTAQAASVSQIEQMAAQANAATTQASAAKAAAETAQQSLVAAQRAWVDPYGAGFDGPLTKGQNINVDVQYTNTGREPATSFVTTVFHSIAAPEEISLGGAVANKIGYVLQRCIASGSTSATRVIYPTASGVGPNIDRDRIPGAEISDDLVAGKKLRAVYGCFTYRSFGEVRHSAFCFYFMALKIEQEHFAYCEQGNYAD